MTVSGESNGEAENEVIAALTTYCDGLGIERPLRVAQELQRSIALAGALHGAAPGLEPVVTITVGFLGRVEL